MSMHNKGLDPACKRNYYATDPYNPVFKSPEDPKLRQVRLNALHREHDNPPKLFNVCVKHFHEQD